MHKTKNKRTTFIILKFIYTGSLSFEQYYLVHKILLHVHKKEALLVVVKQKQNMNFLRIQAGFLSSFQMISYIRHYGIYVHKNEDLSVIHEQSTLPLMMMSFGTKYILAETNSSVLIVLKSKSLQLLVSTIAYLENGCSECSMLKNNGVCDKMDLSTPPALRIDGDETFIECSPLVIGITYPVH